MIALHIVVTALIWTITVYKLHDLYRNPRNAHIRVLCLSLAGLALALTLAIEPIAVRIERLAGLAFSFNYLQHALILVVGFGVSGLMLHLIHGRASRRHLLPRAAGLAAAVLVMTVLFTALHPTVRAGPYDTFVDRYGHTRLGTAYLIAFLTALAAFATDIARLAWSHAPHAANRWLRAGLHIGALGCATGVVYCAHKAAQTVIRYLDLRPVGNEQAISTALTLIAAAASVVGITLPSIGPRGAAAVRWVRHYGAYQHLGPLWWQLHRANPHYTLIPPPRHDWLAARHLEVRLRRRITEIHDGVLALRPYLHPHDAVLAQQLADQRGLTGLDSYGYVMAYRIQAAIEARAQDRHAPADDPDALAGFGGADLPTELARLVRVSNALALIAPDVPHVPHRGDTSQEPS